IGAGAPPPRILDAAATLITRARATGDDALSSDPWGANDGFRLGTRAKRVVEFVVEGERVVVYADGHDLQGTSTLRLRSGKIAVIRDGETFEVNEYDPLASAEAEGEVTERIVAPMPGKVTRVLVKEGERVERGQPLVVLEAMKMEHTLVAPGDLEIESVS